MFLLGGQCPSHITPLPVLPPLPALFLKQLWCLIPFENTISNSLGTRLLALYIDQPTSPAIIGEKLPVLFARPKGPHCGFPWRMLKLSKFYICSPVVGPTWQCCVPNHKVPLLSPVVFSMSFVQGERSDNKMPVALGLKGKNLYLSCVMKDGKPVLQLEVSRYQKGQPQLPLKHPKPSLPSPQLPAPHLHPWKI